jgi:hypothetical protein
VEVAALGISAPWRTRPTRSAGSAGSARVIGRGSAGSASVIGLGPARSARVIGLGPARSARVIGRGSAGSARVIGRRSARRSAGSAGAAVSPWIVGTGRGAVVSAGSASWWRAVAAGRSRWRPRSGVSQTGAHAQCRSAKRADDCSPRNQLLQFHGPSPKSRSEFLEPPDTKRLNSLTMYPL